MYEKGQLYVYDGANWKCLGQQSISYSHVDDCGEQGDNGMKDGWSFSVTSEPIKVCKKMKRFLHKADSHSRKFNRQFADLRSKEIWRSDSCYPKCLLCVIWNK